MLYALGSNGSAQLGVGHANDLATPAPVILEEGTAWTVTQLAAGGNHTVLLCSDGLVRVAGSTEDGRCGMQDEQNLSQFTILPLPTDDSGKAIVVKKISAMWATTIIAGEDGSVYACGAGTAGDGRSSAEWQAVAPFPVRGTKVIDVASGMAHTVVVLSNGDVWGWGKGRKGQLGEPAADTQQPRKMGGIGFKAVKAVCGKDFTCVLGAPSRGLMTMLGPNGLDRFRVRGDAPAPLAGWKDVVASWGSIYALMATGHIVAWGRDDHGQLPPLCLADVAAIAAGSEHCLILVNSGRVLACGWGEHGNCGAPTDEHGDAKPVNEIRLPARCARIFAGCATSFVETEE